MWLKVRYNRQTMYCQTHFDSGPYDKKKKFYRNFSKPGTLIITYHDTKSVVFES